MLRGAKSRFEITNRTRLYTAVLYCYSRLRVTFQVVISWNPSPFWTLSCLSLVPLNFHFSWSGALGCPPPEHICSRLKPNLSWSCCFHCKDSWTIPRAISRSHSQRFRRHEFWLLSEMLEVNDRCSNGKRMVLVQRRRRGIWNSCVLINQRGRYREDTIIDTVSLSEACTYRKQYFFRPWYHQFRLWKNS